MKKSRPLYLIALAVMMVISLAAEFTNAAPLVNRQDAPAPAAASSTAPVTADAVPTDAIAANAPIAYATHQNPVVAASLAADPMQRDGIAGGVNSGGLAVITTKHAMLNDRGAISITAADVPSTGITAALTTNRSRRGTVTQASTDIGAIARGEPFRSGANVSNTA